MGGRNNQMIKDKNDKTVFAFIKYGELEHLQSLQKGLMYFNTVNFFAKYDESNGIGDRFENIYKITVGKGAKFDLRQERHASTVTMYRLPNGEYLSLYKNDDFFANYFCLYSVVESFDFECQKTMLFNEVMKSYDHLLLIFRPHEFLNRVQLGLQKAKVSKPQMDFITYTDIHYKKERKSYFEKPIKYSYQNEFRIGFLNTEEKTENIDIGDICDISVISTVDELKQITFFKNNEDLLDRLEEKRERLFDEWLAKNLRFEHIEKATIGKRDGESMLKYQNAKNDVLRCQNRYLDFIANLMIEKSAKND